MSSERVEWVEIIEPKTKEHMYANLTTGECVWDPPEGVKVKRTDSSQWWELFDINTHRFYYYNASTQTTVWHRPTDCDIIPLAKLQTLKQNTDPQKRRETSTQTNQAVPQVSTSIDPVSSNGNSTVASASKLSPSNAKGVTVSQTSPVRTRKYIHHHRNSGESRRGRLSEDGTTALCRHTDSGRSSDSSISSAQQRRKQELNAAPCNPPVCTPQVRKRGSAVPAHEPDKWSPHSGLNRSGSFISPRKDASDDSMHEKYFKSVESTPLTRRKLKQQSAGGSSCESASPQSPSSPLQKPQPQPFLQATATRPSLVSSISLAAEAGGARVMHSLERPHQLSRHARERYSDRHLDKDRLAELERMDRYPEKQAVYSVDKPFRQTSLDLRHNASSNWHPPREFTRRQQAEPERYTSSKTSLSSGSSKHRTPPHEPHHNFMRLSSANEQDSVAAVNYKMKCVNLEPPLTEPNVQKHNQRLDRTSTPKDRTKSRRHKKPVEMEDPAVDGEEDDEDGGGSPLYCNWDLRGMQHLLPLQDYIIQQAKLSSRSRYGGESGSDNESGSSRSRSGSESRSLSGHEPDNESSDGGARTPDDDDGSGVYLPHSYAHRPADVEYMNHGVSYYNTFVGFDRQPSPGIHRTSSLGGGASASATAGASAAAGATAGAGAAAAAGALYSPVRSHAHAHFVRPPPEQDIEIFAKDNLNFNKGIFRRKASVRDMLSWTSSSISAPMVGADWDKAHKKAAIDLFRLVQIYMGDRKARPGMTLNSVAQDILHATFANEKLRDELYVQLCRQTTENPLRDSLLRGWELLAVCLAFVPPSPAFQPALNNYVNRHRDPAFADAFPESFFKVGKWPIHVQVSHYAGVACKRLERIGFGGKKQPRKPSTEDIDQARIQIFRQSMFGNTLSEVMALQKERFPNRQLPWVQVALSQQVLALNGRETEGIFRVSADVDEVNALKAKIDSWELPDASTLTDAHAPASLLKLWYRELYEPLIPDALYAACVAAGGDVQACSRALQRLPPLNRLVLTYLISFLQQFTAPEVVSQTKMDSANLAMVFAPNCLRCTSQDPRVILENARKEMTFLKTLISNLDTSHVRDLV
ncbi:rho GTPase-activating protein 39 isoform X2 [Ostrinia furnacalis]|uniref:rho GTPase-activating protein 39 isoform X1 n=1 Tax=Ostrinia furnacalis TaxID=93504 RepID=UPI00104081A5|nr:rho GTPase-activating protein 39 isoform X1 [Ostrinia furnacalis]XP_028163537.1 rho GTPase-activating protein 39 isoform X2 [Ostrinia furnacalis]